MSDRLTKAECDRTAQILTAATAVFEGQPTKLVLNALVFALADIIVSVDEERRDEALKASIKALKGFVADRVPRGTWSLQPGAKH